MQHRLSLCLLDLLETCPLFGQLLLANVVLLFVLILGLLVEELLTPSLFVLVLTDEQPLRNPATTARTEARCEPEQRIRELPKALQYAETAAHAHGANDAEGSRALSSPGSGALAGLALLLAWAASRFHRRP